MILKKLMVVCPWLFLHCWGLAMSRKIGGQCSVAGGLAMSPPVEELFSVAVRGCAQCSD